jgi:hypothetical protein
MVVIAHVISITGYKMCKRLTTDGQASSLLGFGQLRFLHDSLSPLESKSEIQKSPVAKCDVITSSVIPGPPSL